MIILEYTLRDYSTLYAILCAYKYFLIYPYVQFCYFFLLILIMSTNAICYIYLLLTSLHCLKRPQRAGLKPCAYRWIKISISFSLYLLELYSFFTFSVYQSYICIYLYKHFHYFLHMKNAANLQRILVPSNLTANILPLFPDWQQ